VGGRGGGRGAGGSAPTPQPPNPNPQSPIPIDQDDLNNLFYLFQLFIYVFIILLNKCITIIFILKRITKKIYKMKKPFSYLLS